VTEAAPVVATAKQNIKVATTSNSKQHWG